MGGQFLTDNDKAVIRERRHGWEQASASLLARVFGVSVQRITAICKPDEATSPLGFVRQGAVRRESTAPDNLSSAVSEAGFEPFHSTSSAKEGCKNHAA